MFNNIQIGFTEAQTNVFRAIIDLHHNILQVELFIFIFICGIFSVIFDFDSEGSNPLRLIERNVDFIKKINHNWLIETIWTTTPALILLFLALPSFVLLYSMDSVRTPQFTLKVIGKQWYWSYDYSTIWNILDLDNIVTTTEFDCFLIPEDILEKGSYRLLETDIALYLPSFTYCRLLVTSADVLHSWAIPAFGIKIDACPGRLNQIFFWTDSFVLGFYGQCSEICGINHGFMPIFGQVVPFNIFKTLFFVNEAYGRFTTTP